MSENPAEALRRAAKLMRERAAAAWPGPWDYKTEVGGFGPVGCVLMPLPGHEGARTGLTSYVPLGTQDAATAEHIASWHPLVAAAVAEWLDAAAQAWDEGMEWDEALAVADAYLNEAQP